jgi:hypothetical protein
LSLIFALLTLPSSILTGLPLSPMEVAVLGRNDFDILVLELSWRYSLKVSWIALLNKMEEVAVLDVSILDDMVDMTVGSSTPALTRWQWRWWVRPRLDTWRMFAEGVRCAVCIDFLDDGKVEMRSLQEEWVV